MKACDSLMWVCLEVGMPQNGSFVFSLHTPGKSDTQYDPSVRSVALKSASFEAGATGSGRGGRPCSGRAASAAGNRGGLDRIEEVAQWLASFSPMFFGGVPIPLKSINQERMPLLPWRSLCFFLLLCCCCCCFVLAAYTFHRVVPT